MNKLRLYCDECRCEQEIVIKERTAEYTFRKEPFQIEEEYAECKVCDQDVTYEALDTRTLKKLSKMYEIRHSYTPELLKEIRLSFNLPQALFAKLVNMGISTIKRYETGTSSPDSTQIGIYMMLRKNPKSIKQFFEQHESNFTFEEIQVVRKKMAPYFEEPDLADSTSRLLELACMKGDAANIDISAMKIFHMILYFSREEVLKTKLMKLLFYADYLAFKRMDKSISGFPYWHKQFGPVPVKHDLILGCLEGMEWIQIDEEENKEGYTKMKVVSRRFHDSNLFSTENFAVMEYVGNFFKEFGSHAISEFAHKEKGWRETQEEQIIPYHYAHNLQLA